MLTPVTKRAEVKPMNDEKILTTSEMKRIIEAVLFAAGHPVTFEKLAEVMGVDEETAKNVVL